VESGEVPEQTDWFLAGFAAGSRIAGYRLEEQIGAGGMAVVFRARDERLNRLVALKVLAPALAADAAFRRRFIRESRATAAADDPHIIPVFEAGEADGVLFIAMRFVPGGDVRALVDREGPLAAAQAVEIIFPVASALDAAHAIGLIHRDVKPANMLMDTRPGRSDHVYLSDFGLSKGPLTSVGLTGTGQFLGTLDYSAPEQIEGKPVDGRTDEYALACAAFELLAGTPPFRRDEPMAVIYAKLSEPPPMVTSQRPDLPAAVDAVFTKALARAPADRYATCREFADALRQALGLTPYQYSPGAIQQADHQPADVAELVGSGTSDEVLTAAAATTHAAEATTTLEPAPVIAPEAGTSALVRRLQEAPGSVSQPATATVPAPATATAHPHASWISSGPPQLDPAEDKARPAPSPGVSQTRRRVLIGLASVAAAGGLAAAGWNLSSPKAAAGPGTKPTPPTRPRPGAVIWSFATGGNVGSRPALADGIVYFGSNDHNLYAVDARTSTKLWSFATGGRIVSSPAVADGVVYVGSEDGKIYALSADPAKKLLWSYPTQGAVESSPVVGLGVVYVGSEDGNLYALSAGSGNRLLWKYPIGGKVDSSPAIADGVVYIGGGGGIYAVSTAGVGLSSFATSDYVDSSPAFAGGILYVGSADNYVYALNASQLADKRWSFKTNGKVAFSSPAVADGVVYIGSEDASVYAIRNGTKLWSFQTGGEVDSSPAVADGVVYIGSNDKNLYALTADHGSKLWSFQTQGHVFSSPTVVDDVVYVGSDDYHLYALRT
jgi:outer membrane protein assembly factor BamB/serine/threonine protein kinase